MIIQTEPSWDTYTYGATPYEQSTTTKGPNGASRNSIKSPKTSMYFIFSLITPKLTMKAILDVPCCLFVDELLAAYPAAKVILNTRDPDEWLESVQKSLFAMFAWPSWRILKYTDPYGCGRYREHDRLIWAAFCGHDPGERCRQAFIEHNNYVKKVVPPDKLLVYEINEGWRPLCRFLDVPVPEMPFPYTNSLPSFFMYLGGAWRMFVWRSIRNVVVVLGIVAMGYWLLRKGLYLF